ncbi:sensor histidine kinase [Halobacteriovorax sp. DPLXC-1]|uniref:sensor histidine kinase n=1 Tax=Halobacteriovorax sp. DPLXC-1 TaxID=3110771 RepID=UPI002FEEAB0D
MTLELYTSLLRYLTTAAGSFFIYQLLLAVINYQKLKERRVLWHAFMCLSTSIYCILLAINTHVSNVATSNLIIGMTWGVAFLAYFFYLNSLEAYFGEKIRLLSFMKVYCVLYTLMQTLCSFIYFFFDYNFLFNISNNIGSSLFYSAMNLSITPNYIGQSSGIIGAIGVVFTSAVIWHYINRHDKRELFLKVGIIVSLLVSFNDSAIGINATGAILPLFFLGNVFESVRFNIYYSKLSIEKVLCLEKEVINLSKAAQFGFAAASIAHDIKNHIFVVSLAANKILKNTKEEDLNFVPINTINKHNSRILEITDLYMNVFKDNFSSELKRVPIRKIVEESVELIQEKVKESNIDLILEIDDFEISCNQAEITMCIVNLIKNSMEAITSDEEVNRPWIKLKTSSKAQSIEVIDSGSGVKKEHLDSIFELGFSTKPTTGGNGIGLAITKELLTRSGFNLVLDSNATNTTFRISL